MNNWQPHYELAESYLAKAEEASDSEQIEAAGVFASIAQAHATLATMKITRPGRPSGQNVQY